MVGLSLSVRALVARALFACAGIAVARAQGIPSGWNTSPPSGVDVKQLSQMVAATVAGNATSSLPHDVADVSRFIYALSIQDRLNGSNTFNSSVTQQLANVTINPPDNSSTRDRLHAALAQVYAHLAYNTPGTIESATSLWDEVYDDFIIGSPSDSQSSLVKLCSSVDLTGGLYTDDAHTAIESADVGMFMALSGYLYEVGQNQSYLETASIAAGFLQSHLNVNGFVSFGLSPPPTSNCSASPNYFAGDAGAVIEGLSILENHNSSWTLFLQTLANNAMIYGPWNNPGTGLLYSNGPTVPAPNALPKGNLIRGLSEAARRNSGTELANIIDEYITVQLNAIIASSNLAAGFFPATWNPPAPSSFNINGSIATLPVLNAAAFDSVSTNTTGPDFGNQNKPSSESTNVGAIAGGVVGGVAFLGLASTALWFYRRRRTSRRGGPVLDYMDVLGEGNHRTRYDSDLGMYVEPFLLPSESPQSSEFSRSHSRQVSSGSSVGGDMSQRYYDPFVPRADSRLSSLSGQPSPFLTASLGDRKSARRLEPQRAPVSDDEGEALHGSRWTPDDSVIASIVQRVVHMLPITHHDESNEAPPEYLPMNPTNNANRTPDSS